ncbi:MAG: MFS transporter [Candidatus Nanopelagicales bacterium]|nr:MFS transporter [Candidatus Nanopelagicales bacterium]
MRIRTRSTATPAVEPLVTLKFFLVLVAAFTFFVGVGMTLPIMPVFVKDELGGSSVAIGIVVAVQALSAIAVRPWINPRVVRFGAVPIIVWAAAFGGLSIALMPLSPNVITLIVLRLVLGGAQAAMMVAMLSAVMSWVSEWRRAEATSVFSVAPYIGLAIGPVVGQLIFVSNGGGHYEAAFLVAGIIAVAGAVPVVTLRKSDIKVAAADRLTGADRPPAFYLPALLPGTVLALGIVGMVGMNAFLPLYAPTLGTTQVQWMFFFYSAVVLSVRLFGRRIPDRIGPRRAGISATVAIVIGLALFAITPSWQGIYLAIVPLAIGIALQYPGLMALVLSDVDDRTRPSAISTFTMFFDIAQGLGGLVVGLAAAFGGYRSVFAVGAVCSLIGLAILVGLVLPRYARSGALSSPNTAVAES